MKPAPAIAEITGSAITATYLTGLQLDEVLARYAGSGNNTLLTDVLGSVIAQTNDQQGIQNFYAYTPYGEVQPLGPDDNNPIQYTARENDQTGLYYYRARYYDPVLKRFISEDPIGLNGGLNVYSYVNGDPVSFTDPNGELAFAIPVAIGAVIGGGTGAIQARNSCSSIFAGALTGALAGAAAGFIPTNYGLLVGSLLGGLAAGAGNAVNQLAGNDPFSFSQLAVQTGIGIGSGALGYGAGLKTALGFVAANRPATSAATNLVVQNALARGAFAGAVTGGAVQTVANLPVPTSLGGFYRNNGCTCR
jgi:RHS repeat-associated protein